MSNRDDFTVAAQRLIDAGQLVHARGWAPATSGNFSLRLPTGEIAITVSGRDKGALTVDDIMRVDAEGAPLCDKKPSAETLLHVQLYRHYSAVNAVFHTHSLNGTLVSRLFGAELRLEGYELLKAVGGVDTHDTRIRIPILSNDQSIPRLAQKVEQYLESYADLHAYLIRGHGLYTWGETAEDALRHLDAFEFLFECEMKLRGVMST